MSGDPGVPGGSWKEAKKVGNKEPGKWKRPSNDDDQNHRHNIDGIIAASTNLAIQGAFHLEGSPLYEHSLAPLVSLISGPLLAGFSISRLGSAFNDPDIKTAFPGFTLSALSFVYSVLNLSVAGNDSPAAAGLITLMTAGGWVAGNEMKKYT